MDNQVSLQAPQAPGGAPAPKPVAPQQPKKVTAAPVTKRRKVVSLDKKKARGGWFFVLPFILGFAIIYLPIICESFMYSVCSMTPDKVSGTGFTLKFVGFANYQNALFEDANFVTTLISGITDLIVDIPAIVIFSLFIAVILNQKVLGRAAFRAIFFIPVICATGIISSIDATNSAFLDYMADQSSGIQTGATDSFSVNADSLTALFENMKIGTEITQYVVGAVNGIGDIINRSGVQMLIFLAGLQSISPAIYESCSIDGATTWETFWKITLPMISPMILVNSVYTVIDSFTAESNKVMQFISNMYTSGGADGRVVSAAMAWVYFAIIIVLVIVVAAVLKAYTFYQRRD